MVPQRDIYRTQFSIIDVCRNLRIACNGIRLREPHNYKPRRVYSRRGMLKGCCNYTMLGWYVFDDSYRMCDVINHPDTFDMFFFGEYIGVATYSVDHHLSVFFDFFP